jgi:hypothetical protein
MFDMFPPSAGLLEECPQFESLHKKLTLSFLDQDGTIKSELASSSRIQVDDIYMPFTRGSVIDMILE